MTASTTSSFYVLPFVMSSGRCPKGLARLRRGCQPKVVNRLGIITANALAYCIITQFFLASSESVQPPPDPVPSVQGLVNTEHDRMPSRLPYSGRIISFHVLFKYES